MSLLLTISDDFRILLDAGEGTYLQLAQHFGEEKLPKVLASIRVAYITHFHADHHLGLLRVLKERQVCGEKLEPVFTVIPKNMEIWFTSFSAQIEVLETTVLFSNTLAFLTKDPTAERPPDFQ